MFAKPRYDAGVQGPLTEVTSLESPCGGYRAQRVQTEEVKAVLSALEARSLTVSTFNEEDGVQRRHDHLLFHTAITFLKIILYADT